MIKVNDVAVAELTAMKSAWRDLAVDWELKLQERRALLPMGGEDSREPPIDTERRMRILIEIRYRLRVDDEAEFLDWLRFPCEALGYLSPLEAMSGTVPELRRFRAFIEMGFGS